MAPKRILKGYMLIFPGLSTREKEIEIFVGKIQAGARKHNLDVNTYSGANSLVMALDISGIGKELSLKEICKKLGAELPKPATVYGLVQI